MSRVSVVDRLPSANNPGMGLHCPGILLVERAGPLSWNPLAEVTPKLGNLPWHGACSDSPIEEELGMLRSLQILFGMVVGCIGFMQIGENPVQGSTALLVGGFLVLSGVDRFFEIQNK